MVAEMDSPMSALPQISHYPLRWKALIVLGATNLMFAQSVGVVGIGLPSMQQDLGMSDGSRQWVVTAYGLAFGGLLLLGGRISDFAGRKRVFIIGLGGFAFASGLGGLAVNEFMLVFSRGLQGVFAALVAPTVLSLLTYMFIDIKERSKAFGVYGATAGMGSATGLMLGGFLTEYASWRWTLLISLPMALVMMVGAVMWFPDPHPSGDRRYDLPGALLSTLGLFSLVYGLSQIGGKNPSWSTAFPWIGLATLLIFMFFIWEKRSSHPLLPLFILMNRNRGGAYLTSLLVATSWLSMFLFLSYYFQVALKLSPVQNGLMFLPFATGMVISATIASKLLPKYGPRYLPLIGIVMAVIALVLFSKLELSSSYATHVLPGMLIGSLGVSFIMVPLSSVALFGVGAHDSGVASGVLTMVGALGGAVGLAVLNTIAAMRTNTYAAAGGVSERDPAAQLAGYTTAFAWTAGFVAIAGVVWLVMIRMSKADMAIDSKAARDIVQVEV